MTNKEAIARIEDIDRFDAYHLDSNEFTEDDHNSIKEVINWLKTLEERPTGKWIEKVERRGCFAGDKTVYSYTCPFCGAKEFKKYPFCHCGADMRGDRE